MFALSRRVGLRFMVAAAIFSAGALVSPALMAQQPSTTAVAATTGQAQRPSLMLLIAEEVVDDAQRPAKLSFWWADPANAAPSAADKVLMSRLSEGGVQVQAMEAKAPISRIYRVPVLTRANAAALLTLLGARQGAVGKISVRPLALEDPFGQKAYRAYAKIALVQAGQPEQAKELVVERVVTADDAKDAMRLAKQQALEALGDLLAGAARSSSGPVGVEIGERLLLVQAAPNMPTFEALEQALLKIKGVERVQVRWVSSGHIALEINPHKRDADDLLDSVARGLEGTTLELGLGAYKVVRASSAAVSQGAAEVVRLEPLMPSE